MGFGLPVSAEAAEHTWDGILDAIVQAEKDSAVKAIVLDIDSPEPPQLPLVLLAPFLDAPGPDFGRDLRLLVPAFERGGQRRLRAAVHR